MVQKLVSEYDSDEDGKLDSTDLKAAMDAGDLVLEKARGDAATAQHTYTPRASHASCASNLLKCTPRCLRRQVPSAAQETRVAPTAGGPEAQSLLRLA